MALFASFMHAFVYITIRSVRGKSSVFETISYFGIVAIFLSPIGIIF